MSQTESNQGIMGRFTAPRTFFPPIFPPGIDTPILSSLSLNPSLPPLHAPTPCITSLPALPAHSAVLRRRLLAPFLLAARTKKLSFPTMAARASSRASTCLQTLSVLRLDRKVCRSPVVAFPSLVLLTCPHVGRNVIIEQSFGGPKITKGKQFLPPWPSLLFSVVRPLFIYDLHLPKISPSHIYVGIMLFFRWCHSCQGHNFEGQV